MIEVFTCVSPIKSKFKLRLYFDSLVISIFGYIASLINHSFNSLTQSLKLPHVTLSGSYMRHWFWKTYFHDVPVMTSSLQDWLMLMLHAILFSNYHYCYCCNVQAQEAEICQMKIFSMLKHGLKPLAFSEKVTCWNEEKSGINWEYLMHRPIKQSRN